MKVGIFGHSYPQKRLMNNIVKGVDYVNLYNFGNVISHKLNLLEFALPYRFDVDGYHSMNLVPLTNKPWCASFETAVPRVLYGKTTPTTFGLEFILSRIARPNCIALMSLSDKSVEIEQNHLFKLVGGGIMRLWNRYFPR